MSYINETERIFDKTLRGAANTASGRIMNRKLEEWRDRYKKQVNNTEKRQIKVTEEQAKVFEALSGE